MKNNSYLRHYFELLTRFNPEKFGFTVSLMVFISLTEGIGLAFTGSFTATGRSGCSARGPGPDCRIGLPLFLLILILHPH